MLFKETVCPECRGHGFITESTECSISSKPCPAKCYEGRIVVPMTNGDLLRTCNNSELTEVFKNLATWDINANKSADVFAIWLNVWLNKPTDETDLKIVFTFVDEKDFEHPWTKVAEI